jgi:hypothetical protein
VVSIIAIIEIVKIIGLVERLRVIAADPEIKKQTIRTLREPILSTRRPLGMDRIVEKIFGRAEINPSC